MFQTFEDLETYKAARELRKQVYAIAHKLPAFEKYNPESQIRRAALSLTNNIAEGHGRFHYSDQIKFALQARGSLEEIIDDLNTCEDERYIPAQDLQATKQSAWHVLKLLNGYLAYLRNQKLKSGETLREDPIVYAESKPVQPHATPVTYETF